MSERSEAFEQHAVQDASRAYQVEAEIATAEDVPPGYKWTEVGVIPKEWEVRRVEGHVRFLRNGTNSRAELTSGGKVKYLHYGDIHTTSRVRLDPNAIEMPSLPKERARSLDRLVTGDLVFADASEDIEGVGRSLEVQIDSDTEVVAGLHTIAARFDKSLLVDGFKAYLQFCPSFARHLRRLAAGTKVYATNQSHIASAALALPKDYEQHAIATALWDADALIESLDRLIAKKRAIKQAAMQQLFTGETRLPGFEGEWEIKRLGDHGVFLKTGTNSRSELTPGGAVLYLHYGDIHGHSSAHLNPMTERLPRIAREKVQRLTRLQEGDLVFVDASEDLDGVGKSVEIGSVPIDGVVAGLHTIAARFDKAVVADGFKGYLQSIPAVADRLRQLAAGTKVLATNRRHIAGVKVALPSAEEQTAIASVLSDMDAEIEALERRRDKAGQIKQAMMQQLLTGRVRLVEPNTTESATC